MAGWLGKPLCLHLCPSTSAASKHQAGAAFVLLLYRAPSTIPLLNKDLQPPKIRTPSLPAALQRPWLCCPRQQQPGQGVEMGWRADLGLRECQSR